MRRLAKDSRTCKPSAAYGVHTTRVATLITHLRSSCASAGNTTTRVNVVSELLNPSTCQVREADAVAASAMRAAAALVSRGAVGRRSSYVLRRWPA